MQGKTKECQNCKESFVIEEEDFDFYKKIEVPEPTFCPECRSQRRLIARNATKLYKRKCDFSGKEIISVYHSESPFVVYDYDVWNSDKWDVMDYGRDYDFSKSFFKQFWELATEVPWPSRPLVINEVDCHYCVFVINSKNCYLSLVNTCENCLYAWASLSKDCVDVYMQVNSEGCYENVDCKNNYNVFFAQNSSDCINSSFLYNCQDCQDCFGCINLRHKKYHIFNRPYSKEEYKKELLKYQLASYEKLGELREKFEMFKMRFPHRFANIFKVENVTGDNIKNAKNCRRCFDSFDTEKITGADASIENCRYINFLGTNTKDSYDCFDVGTSASLLYEDVTVGTEANKILFSTNILKQVHSIEYSSNCHSCHDIFGCIGLRHKSYCIFNKQYTKEEYEELVLKIKQHMNDMPYTDKQGNEYKYGEFFPPELSPFGYNETIAQEYFPLTKKEAQEKKYKWHDKLKGEYRPTVKAKDLPDNIKDVKHLISKEIIECDNEPKESCQGSGVYQIIPAELEFLKKQRLPLPRLCPDCRHTERIKQRNPMKLHKRQCMCGEEKDVSSEYQNQTKHNHGSDRCPNTFQTTFAPDRKEIVYCKECYQRETE